MMELRNSRTISFPCGQWRLLTLFVLYAVWTTSAIELFRAIDVLNHNRGDQGIGRKSQLRLSSSDDEKVQKSYPEQPLKSPNGEDVQELYLEQLLDHFSEDEGASNGTFRQRYFYSSRHAQPIKRPNAPVYAFLCAGGEGPSLDESVLMDSDHCSGDMLELARMLHDGQQAIVHLFALEHRYYGSSYPEFTNQDGNPVSPVTNDNLVYLSSRQALADLSHFIATMNDSYDLKHETKWITFGGSYPGMMAAWARLEYPELVHAAVSNSAPIQMRVDFSAYLDRVSFDLQYPLVGGSQECLQIVLDGHAEIVDALAAGYHEKTARLFHVCDAQSLLIERNVDMWVGDGVIDIPAQGNDPTCEDLSCNIGKLCEIIVEERNQSTPLEVLATVSRLQNGDDCLLLDWNRTITYLASEEAQEGGLRSWLWQTCSEFGFFQTCEDGSLCPFARGFHTLDMDFEICEQAFGISRGAVVANVQRSLQHYGGWNMDAWRVISVNGDVDPWSMLALTNDRDGLPTHWVKGASHHFWTHAVKDTDSQEVKDARDIIYLKVTQWLEEDSDLLRPLLQQTN